MYLYVSSLIVMAVSRRSIPISLELAGQGLRMCLIKVKSLLMFLQVNLLCGFCD